MHLAASSAARGSASPRPLRIALFSGNYNYLRDGANQALNRLVDHAERRLGAQVRVYSPTTDTPAFAPAGELVSVPSIGIPGRGEYRLALGLPRRIRADLEAFAPDLVHLSAPDLLGSAAQKWARSRRLPVITSLHTRFETYFAYYGLGWARRLAERRLARFYGRSDYVLVPAPGILDEMAATRRDGRVRLWARGVDHERFSPVHRDMAWRQNQGFADDDIVILFFGRLVREKGIGLFIDAVRQIHAAGVAARPLVVGTGPELERFSDALPDAIFTGHLDGRQLGQAVASADILLTPSITEAFGNVVLEAMASGLAVISADAPSAQPLIENGRTGWLCPAGDVEAFTATALRMIAEPEMRREIGGAARQASLSFEWERTLDVVLAVYGEALDGPEACREALRHAIVQPANASAAG